MRAKTKAEVKTRFISIRMSADDYRACQAAAKADRRKLADWMRLSVLKEAGAL